MQEFCSTRRIMEIWSEQLKAFYRRLTPKVTLPEGFDWLMPYKRTEVLNVLDTFLDRFYNDNNKRILLLGINPGRYGAGVTGINFTAPRQLNTVLNIESPFGNQSELSADFVYEVIDAFGGPQQFYSHCFLSSVCPLGLLYKSKNINYYDDKMLFKQLEPFIIASLKKQALLPICRQTVICIGGDKNYRFLSALNQQLQLFENIKCLPHPRFIMQYRRKTKDMFVNQYVEVLRSLVPC